MVHSLSRIPHSHLQLTLYLTISVFISPSKNSVCRQMCSFNIDEAISNLYHSFYRAVVQLPGCAFNLKLTFHLGNHLPFQDITLPKDSIISKINSICFS